jgi:hypothetical protein
MHVLAGPKMDPARLDLVLQFTLAAAAQEDAPWQRELGPIHLIKYAYLADLGHAARHGGETYTGVPWRFYHFGPWALEVNDRIPRAAESAGAERLTFKSAKYDGERTRYRLQDDAAIDHLARVLPGEVASAVRHAVHEFTNDTYALLNHVYLTKPMLRAAPGEYLVFEGEEPAIEEVGKASAEPEGAKLSWKQRKAKEAKLAALRKQVRERLAERVSNAPAPVSPQPRYDEVFFEGLRWLDELAGSSIEPTEAEAVFSDDIWKSGTRGGREVP